jgi:hypothetical protein
MAIALGVVSLLISVGSVAIALRAFHVSHRPTVWGVASPRRDGKDTFIGVQIHNGGPGVAIDVAAARSEPTGRRVGRLKQTEEWKENDRSPFVRTLEAGKRFPPADSDWFSVGPNRTIDDVLGVVARYSDATLRRWEFPVALDPHKPSSKPRRVRRYPWQFWWLRSDW